jgi:hypothetical protein
MLTGNRGEWSEIYVLLKLLGDGEIYGGDGNLSRLPSMLFSIIKVIRQESAASEFQYSIGDNYIEIQDKDGNTITAVNRSDFTAQASNLLNTILKEKGTFAASKTEAFMHKISCSTIKAKSSDKADIKLVVYDEKTGQEPLLGFSIKSRLGAASTLINAGPTTNFKYKLTNLKLTTKEISDFNKLKVKNLVQSIHAKAGRLKFQSVVNSMFESNLTLVDSKLPELIADILLAYYNSSSSRVSELTEIAKAKNPLGYNLEHGHDYYTYKIKKYFTEAALGMLPSKVWHGEYHANGGYIIVKEDGDVLCYHVYHRNTLEDYLFANTKLETASTSKHGFGKLYEEDGDVYILLNFQVRFI